MPMLDSQKKDFFDEESGFESIRHESEESRTAGGTGMRLDFSKIFVKTKIENHDYFELNAEKMEKLMAEEDLELKERTVERIFSIKNFSDFEFLSLFRGVCETVKTTQKNLTK